MKDLPRQSNVTGKAAISKVLRVVQLARSPTTTSFLSGTKPGDRRKRRNEDTRHSFLTRQRTGIGVVPTRLFSEIELAVEEYNKKYEDLSNNFPQQTLHRLKSFIPMPVVRSLHHSEGVEDALRNASCVFINLLGIEDAIRRMKDSPQSLASPSVGASRLRRQDSGDLLKEAMLKVYQKTFFTIQKESQRYRGLIKEVVLDDKVITG